MWKIKTGIKSLCVICAAVIATSSTASQVTTKATSDMQRATVPGASNDTVTLGTAYHSEKQGFYSVQSVKGLVDDSYGNSELNLSVGVDMGYSQLANLIDGSLSAALDIPSVSASAGAYYARQNAADNYNATYTLYASVKPKKRVLLAQDGSGFQPTQAGLDIVNANPGDKFENIGDEFVTAIEYNSQVIVTLKFEFKNAEEKVNWGGHLSVDWIGYVSVAGKLDATDEQVKRDIKITVSAKQLGGDETQLLSVIPSGLASCSMANPQPCFNIFANTVRYIKTDYLNQFNSLDDYNVARIFTDDYYTSGPELHRLTPSGHYPSKTLLTKLLIKNMAEFWVGSLLDHRRADNLLNYYSANLSSADRTALEALREGAILNSVLWANAYDYCQNNPIGDYCHHREIETRGFLHQYDRNLLEL